MLNINRLGKKMKVYDLDLTEEQLQRLDIYAEFLMDWNTRINLTAIKEPEEIENKHMVDCLLLACQPEIEGSIVDVGSGAGFPGIVLSIYKPYLGVTLMEPTGKRCAFLKAISEKLGLPVAVVKERAEEASRKAWRESFNVATARAVAALPVLCEFCLPLVKPGGVFVAMKGEAGKEIADAAVAIERLGGKFRETREFILPDGSLRSLVFIDKVESTPRIYPRNGGTISKRPILG